MSMPMPKKCKKTKLISLNKYKQEKNYDRQGKTGIGGFAERTC